MSINGVTLISDFADTFLLFLHQSPYLAWSSDAREQADSIDACVANAIDNLNDVAVLCTEIAFTKTVFSSLVARRSFTFAARSSIITRPG
jgi:hypothetical protein